MQCLLPSGLSSDPNDTADLDPTTASSEPGDPEPTEPWKERVKRRLRECCRSSAEQCRQLWRRLRGHMACLGEKLLKRIQESPVGQRLPSRVQVLGFVHRRITETLILTVFIFVNFFAMNFMTILQQLLCLWMLVLPKRISVLLTDRLLMAAACLSLVAQILGFAGWHGFSEEQALYFGVAPRLSDVCRDLFVIILAMIEGLLRDATELEVLEDPIPLEQEMVVFGPVNRGSEANVGNAAPRSLGDLQDTPEVVRPLDPVTEVGRLVTAVPQLAALAIVVINFFEETVWCLPSLLVVGCFYATGGMVKPPVSSNPWQLPERGRLWIQVMVISLALGMLGEICCTLWLPPFAGLSPKPVPEIIADWEMCRNYDPWNPMTPRNLEGQAQTRQILEADWVTQRQRCGSDVVYWLCLDSGLRVPKFALFFTLCWVLHSREISVSVQQTPETREGGTPRWVHWTLDGISNYIYEGNRTAAQKESDLKLFLISLSTILCWISVIAAFLFQQHFNMVALGYLWMAMVTSSSAFNATLYQNPTRAILWPARAVGIFNFMVIVASSVCQCPSFPCPYSSELRGPLPGELHVTRFLSGEQCLYFSKNAVSGQVSDAWLMGPLFQSVGMMKTGGQSKGSLQELVHCLVFATCLLQRILVERWNSDLHEHFERRKALLEFRAQWYAEKLATSRQVQLSMWDTKRQVLLNKLSRVTQQLNTLRSIWDGQRPAFTEKEEEENLHRARVEHICLQGGVNELLVTGLLREFTKKCGEEAIQELNTQKRLQAHSIIDKAVVEYLHRRYLRKLKMITSADEAASKKLLLEDSQQEVESLFEEVQETQETETEALPPERSSLRQRKVSDKPVTTSVSWQSEEGSKSDESKPSGATVSPFWADLCGTFLDDMLFIRENDETLYEHRKGNSAKLLLLKSLLSQSVPALVIASALQFMAFRSIPAGLSVSIVVVALMAFPHVPWSVWVTLQWLNISVIFAKVVFQLPVFCEDGSLNLMAHCKALCGREMPWTALMGLVKTEQTASDPCSLARPSLTAVLWADVLFSAVVLLVMFASRMGGRFGNTSQILTSLKAVEKKNRRMSTHTNREMLKAVFLAERTADFEEDEEDEDEETGRDVAGPSGAASSSATPEDGSRWVMMTKHVRGEYKKFVELGRHWWKENVMAPAYVRKPARDLYELRLCLALTCLSILIFGWSSMVDSGRSFSTSLKTNHFSVTQVTVLVLFLTMIVVDRALYTWYRGDRRDEENTVATAASKTLAFASMKGLAARVVLKMLILVHVICIHALFVQQWSRKVVRKEKLHHEVSLISMSTLSGFYVLYLTYLACSSLQLKYDVHVMRGGLRFCHSTDIGSMLVFKVYSAIPFLNELRVITDWTVTETSMNLFMWLKLEDAHHSLYRTRLDMEGRAMTEPGQARPMFEKVYMGVALLLLLLGLLVGPIIFFSAWNTFMLVPSVVKSASMSVDVKVEASYGHRTLNLYTAVQDYIANHNETSAQQFQKRLVDNEIPISLQDIRFPFASDEFWETSTSRQQMMAELINSSMHADVTVKLRLSYQFNRNSSLPVDGFKEVVVGDTTRTLLSVLMVNCMVPVDPKICPPYADFVVPGLFPKFLRVGTTSHVSAMDFLPEQEEPLNYAVKVAFHRGDVHELPHWRLVTNATETENSPISRTDMAMGQNEKGTRLTFTMASNHISGTKAAPDRAEARNEKMSINGLYLGVVLTIGNLFRSIFKDSSKRMIYEEVNDTDLLLDLCDGIYLARVQGNLQAEWMLYHELIRIYRSPELLAHLSGKKGPSPVGPPRLPESTTSTSRWGKVAEHVRHNGEGTK